MSDLRKALISAADQCDKWAAESLSGGWSTHQVDANRRLADELRRVAAAPPGGREQGIEERHDGWAVFDEGDLMVHTVGPTRRSAIVNWLYVDRGHRITEAHDDDAIEKLWLLEYPAAGATAERVRIRALTSPPAPEISTMSETLPKYVPQVVDYEESGESEFIIADVPTILRRGQSYDTLLDMRTREVVGFRWRTSPPA